MCWTRPSPRPSAWTRTASPTVTVKSQVMVVFGDNKSFADEMATWRDWQRRQTGGGPPRILGIEPKNCTGVVGPIDSVAMNGVQFYWNPEQGAKLSVAVHCLSTEFSLQKGVKGLPMNVQIDTYDENISETVPFHRGYCQIKVFCDKGAERKLRDEYRRQQKRKQMNRPRKSDFEYHEPCDKSEFYHMSDLQKPAALYPGNTEEMETLRRTSMSMDSMEIKGPSTDRVVIYGKRREDAVFTPIVITPPSDAVFTPIVITPPSVVSLAHAVAERLGVAADKVVSVFKHCRKGATVRFDDDMIRFYSSGDIFILELGRSTEDPNGFALNLYEQVDPNARTSYQPTKAETSN
uniref:CP2 domain-containing protein n=1 Tax=Steinernema glaseri TaxID=37863 RepID=A0A1I8A5S6_9BILA